MEGRESTVSNSTANTESDSPMSGVGAVPSGEIVPQMMNMSMERSLGGGGLVGEVDLMMGKKKRGRPRKYAPDGNMALALTQAYSSPPSSEFSAKRGRGRPPGSCNRQVLESLGGWAASSAGRSFTPHVVTIYTGEDVADKIFSFAQRGPRAVCILSANGTVSNVTIHQPGYNGGILTYEGRFEILSLSGSYTLTGSGIMRNRTGGLSVSLAGPDGRVIGGVVAGLLLAASPIQVVVGSFMPNNKTHKKKYQYKYPVASAVQGAQDIVTAASPISLAVPDDSNCVTPTSVLPAHSNGEEEKSANGNPNPNSNSGFQADWDASETKSAKKVSPDINECATDE